MNSGTNGNGGPQPGADFHLREVVRSAEHELQQLLRQRAEIMKQIGTVKRTLGGLANIFGAGLLDDDLLVLLDRKTTQRRSGFTRACRMVLMNSPTALDAAQIGEELQREFPELRDRHKNLYASVTTVLGRLTEYAEARTFRRADGRRVWQWITDGNDESTVANVHADTNDNEPGIGPA